MTAVPTPDARPRRLPRLLAAAGLAAVALWAYWPTLEGLAQRWSADAQYSHGFLVPLFAAFLLWRRRGELAAAPARPTWWALPFFAAAAALHLTGGYYYSPWAEEISLLPALAGVVLAVWGWRALRLAAPALAFLLFMVPLPGRLDKALAAPLQRVATLASVNVLQTFGFFAQAEGNVIVLSDYELGIVEACSGLRMLVVFLAASAGVAMIMRRSVLQRALVVLSAVPIALVCNVLRITATGVAHETVGHDAANLLYHDLAGWLMAPLALAFLGVELLLLRRLFRPAAPAAAGAG
jgi:exosortase